MNAEDFTYINSAIDAAGYKGALVTTVRKAIMRVASVMKGGSNGAPAVTPLTGRRTAKTVSSHALAYSPAVRTVVPTSTVAELQLMWLHS